MPDLFPCVVVVGYYGEGVCGHLLFLEQDSHVLHATSISATASVLSVPADSAVTHGHVAPHMSHFSQPCDLNTLKQLSENAIIALVSHTISKIVLIIYFARTFPYILHSLNALKSPFLLKFP